MSYAQKKKTIKQAVNLILDMSVEVLPIIANREKSYFEYLKIASRFDFFNFDKKF